MTIVNSHNDWDPLEEIIIGVSDFWCVPSEEPGFKPPQRSGKRSDEHIDKAAIQMDNLERVLTSQCNVTVRRPEKIDFTQPAKTPFFSLAHQHGASCPRDTLLVIGNEIMETTMSRRARYFESMAYRKIMNDYFEKDKEMLWTMVPKPTMADDMYNVDFPWDINCQERKQWIRNYKYQINETEPIYQLLRFARACSDYTDFINRDEFLTHKLLQQSYDEEQLRSTLHTFYGLHHELAGRYDLFDAAEVLRLGKDLIVQQSTTANKKGIEWLRRHVKSRGYRVHEIHFPDDLYPIHIDSTLAPLVPPTKERKGILVNCPERPIAKEDKERIFEGSNWEIIDAPPPNNMTVPDLCMSSAWLSINMLLVGPDRAVVEETEIPTINFLESLGIKCIRVPYRDCYRFGGGLHCHTLDVRRRGECYNYFPNMDSNENHIADTRA